jgi:hypothetical protein
MNGRPFRETQRRYEDDNKTNSKEMWLEVKGGSSQRRVEICSESSKEEY